MLSARAAKVETATAMAAMAGNAISKEGSPACHSYFNIRKASN